MENEVIAACLLTASLYPQVEFVMPLQIYCLLAAKPTKPHAHFCIFHYLFLKSGPKTCESKLTRVTLKFMIRWIWIRNDWNIIWFSLPVGLKNERKLEQSLWIYWWTAVVGSIRSRLQNFRHFFSGHWWSQTSSGLCFSSICFAIGGQLSEISNMSQIYLQACWFLFKVWYLW